MWLAYYVWLSRYATVLLGFLVFINPAQSDRANCPFQGPAFPKPVRNLGTWPRMQTALADLTTAFEARDTSNATNPNRTSWSIQVFSSSEDTPTLWQYYHTAPALTSSNTTGTKEVDGDSVYRLGSVTKIFTILTFLAEAGDAYWNTPELLAGKAQYDPIMNVDWDAVTLGALASQMAGIVRDYGILGELTQENNQSVLIAQGFPPAPVNETPTCGEFTLCNRNQLFQGIANVPPSFAPSHTPAYSNLGYQLLAYALEAITSKNFTTMLQEDIITPLGLEHTFYQKPPDEFGILPNGTETAWNFTLGEASRAILRNTIISPALTRRWLKPAAYSASMTESVSYPWGVRRIQVGEGNRQVDAYGKAGSIQRWQSLLVLIPEYDVGIAALLAGDWPGNANWDIADVVGEILIPALEDTAREQADAAYAGTYTATDLNSTITLTTTPTKPGLGIETWLSNGTDMKTVAISRTLSGNLTTMTPDVRLYPTMLETALDEQRGTSRVAFKAMIENLGAPDRSDDMFSTNCGTWVSQSVVVYANMPLDQFVFTLDADRNVLSVRNLALRAEMDKEA